jgi:mutator protein MutT
MDKKRIDVAIAIILDPSRTNILICQRRHDTVLGGYWEFPGGKAHADESLEQCAQREVTEELGITVRCLRALPAIEHDYPHALVRLHPFVCQHASGTPQLLAVQAIKWIAPAEILSFDFPPANESLVALVAQGPAALL